MSITTDNASNMNSMFTNLEEKYFNEDLEFSSANQHVYCLAHIINLAVQEILKSLYNYNFEENDEVDEYSDDNEEITTLGALGKALDDLVIIDKSLTKYSLTNNEWKKLEQIKKLLKLEYFKDHDFKDETIEIYQQQIVNLWKTKYMPTLNQNNNQITNKPSGLMAYIVKKRKYTELDELVKYLQEPLVNCNIDILTFWKLHEKDYPNLSKMARDFLAIPGTSVPVERIFSNSADLISSKRYSLNPETIKI
ncbi:17985_t:CDS:2, partial [Dentiscutata erythropus]